MRIKSNTKLANRDIRGKSRRLEVVDRRIEGSGLFLIWAGRNIMMSSVF